MPIFLGYRGRFHLPRAPIDGTGPAHRPEVALSLEQNLVDHTHQLLDRARRAANLLAPASTDQKNAFLDRVAALLLARTDTIVAANGRDLARGRERGLSAAFLDRLSLSEAAVQALAATVIEIRTLPDPVARITYGARRPNGLLVQRVRIPLGVIGMVYESRPNVTIDAGCLCIKAGNAVVLRGGSDASESNAALLALLRQALVDVGLPEDAAQAPAGSGHDAIQALVSVSGGLDLVIPRGGTRLIEAVNKWARVPVIQHYHGVCHLFVHAAADLRAAAAVVVNAKAQRPGVCNALEGLLIDAAIAATAAPLLVAALQEAGVQVRGCPLTRALCPQVVAATDDDYGREFLDLICFVRVVDGLDGAIAHIEAYGSGHTEGILTTELSAANHFVSRVQASCVVVNASTRFNDGGQLGLGAEIGISTSKLHAYGPMGLESLTAEKYVVMGDNHVRN